MRSVWTGTVSSISGVFGEDEFGRVEVGEAMRIVYRYDTNLGRFDDTRAFGGWSFSYPEERPSPALLATVRIGDRAFRFEPQDYGDFDAMRTMRDQVEVTVWQDAGFRYWGSNLRSGSVSSSVTFAQLDYILLEDEVRATSSDFLRASAYVELAYGDREPWTSARMNVESVEIRNVTPVPVPPSLLLLGGAVACFGLARRRSGKPRATRA